MVAYSTSNRLRHFCTTCCLLHHVTYWSFRVHAFLIFKMTKQIQILILIVVMLSSAFLSLKAVFFVGNEFFFDKLFYHKDAKLGYVGPQENWADSKFSNRNADLTKLVSDTARYQQNGQKVLGMKDDKTYKIAVIGDSYVWGQGIADEDRFVHLLEKRLSKIRPTKVVSLSRCGDSIFDNYIKYTQIQKLEEPYDLVIFGLVNNDLIFSEGDSYDETQQTAIQSSCTTGPVAWDNQMKTEEYSTVVERSFDPTSQNYCAFQHILPLLPKEKTLYYNFDEFKNDWKPISSYGNELEKAGLTVISTKSYFESHKTNYPDIFKPNGFDRFQVSPKEGHPSALANKMFSDQLFTEITQNKKWQFTAN